jgi:hypothetical protein
VDIECFLRFRFIGNDRLLLQSIFIYAPMHLVPYTNNILLHSLYSRPVMSRCFSASGTLLTTLPPGGSG